MADRDLVGHAWTVHVTPAAMVNPGKVLKARKSKRQPLKLKHKIERKARGPSHAPTRTL